MKTICLTTSILLFCTLLSEPAGATPSPIQSLKSDFTMIRKVAVLKESLTSKGHLMLAGKGQLRWETTAPSRSILIINGTEGWLHYPDLSVTKAFDTATDPVMKLMSEQLFALTGGDMEALKPLYHISKVSPDETQLIPKAPQMQKLFKELRVTMVKHVVKWVTLVSANGDTTTIEFANTEQNIALGPELFSAPSKGNK